MVAEDKENRDLIAGAARLVRRKGSDPKGEDFVYRMDILSTGSLGLDWATGIGGFPLGSVVEVYGMESSGKTVLGMHVLASAQKSSHVVGIIDVEHKLQPEYARTLGIDLDRVVVAQPICAEDTVTAMGTLAKTCDLVVLDSVGALSPTVQTDLPTDAAKVGRCLVMTENTARENRCCLLLLNQVRFDIRSRRLKSVYATIMARTADMRIMMNRSATLQYAGERIGVRLRASITKNRWSDPGKYMEFDLIDGKISYHGEVYDIATDLGVLHLEGSWTIMDNMVLAQGRGATIDLFQKADDIFEEVEEKIFAKLFPGKSFSKRG